MLPRRNDPPLSPAEIAAIIQAELRPLNEKVDGLIGSIARHVTREDFERMYSEMKTSYVPRDVYEARHAVLIEQDQRFDAILRELRRDQEERHQLIEKRFEHQQETKLSRQDRGWIRASQIASAAAVAVAVAGLIFGHIKFY